MTATNPPHGADDDALRAILEVWPTTGPPLTPLERSVLARLLVADQRARTLRLVDYPTPLVMRARVEQRHKEAFYRAQSEGLCVRPGDVPDLGPADAVREALRRLESIGWAKEQDGEYRLAGPRRLPMDLRIVATLFQDWPEVERAGLLMAVSRAADDKRAIEDMGPVSSALVDDHLDYKYGDDLAQEIGRDMATILRPLAQGPAPVPARYAVRLADVYGVIERVGEDLWRLTPTGRYRLGEAKPS